MILWPEFIGLRRDFSFFICLAPVTGPRFSATIVSRMLERLRHVRHSGGNKAKGFFRIVVAVGGWSDEELQRNHPWGF
jgi:hypothetical protein